MRPYPSLLTIVPSRDRPAAIPALIAAFIETCTADTHLVIAIDDDEPQADAYAAAVAAHLRVTLWVNRGEKTMVAALNGAATAQVAADPATDAIAFMGDDHRPRTQGWDQHYLHSLRAMGSGITYGDDLIQGDRIPTQVAMTADIVQALGHMAPPTLTHLFVDNYWRDLGQGAGCLRYLPHVIVEHLHPIAGKAEWDDGHKRVNDGAMYQRDHLAYSAYFRDHMAADVQKVKALL